jgi:hypothetical protein
VKEKAVEQKSAILSVLVVLLSHQAIHFAFLQNLTVVNTTVGAIAEWCPLVA